MATRQLSLIREDDEADEDEEVDSFPGYGTTPKPPEKEESKNTRHARGGSVRFGEVSHKLFRYYDYV